MYSNVAREMHHGRTVVEYRKAKGWTQQRLADELGVELRTVQRMEQLAMIKDIERRWFLVGLLGIPAILLGLEGKPPPRVSTNFALNEDSIGYLENGIVLRWEMHKIAGSISVAHGLDMWMNEVGAFVKATQGKVWHTRSLSVMSISYLLQGSIARSMKLNYDQAHEAIQNALSIAREIDDPELIASALFREGVTFLNQDKPQKAITSLTGAFDTIHGRPFPVLRGHILKLLSEAHARAQQPQECWRSVGLAESVLEHQKQLPERSSFLQREFSLASVTAQKGVNAAFLHDYQRAVSLINKGLAACNPTFIPTRARLLVQKAEAFYGLGEIDSCVIHAEEVLTLARSVGSNKTVSRVKSLHTSLVQSRWKNEPGVARLGALLAMHSL